MAEIKYLDKDGLSTVWSKVKGIVTPKADKVSGATNGHLAGLNSGGNLTDSGLAATNVAQKDGSYSGMTVGAAEDLVSAESVASEFTSRITGGSTAVGKGGTALVDKIKGRTLVMNQQVTNGNFTVAENWTNLSSVSNNIGYFTFSAQSQYGAQNEPIISGHKYYMRATCLRADVNISLRAGSTNFIVLNFTAAGTLSAVGMSPSDGLANLRIIELRTQNFEPIGITGIVIIDLTLMFGSGSEPTAAEMDALYPDYINTARTGYSINNAATAIETVGWNQWDEEWEVGGFNTSTGEKVTSFSNRIRSVNYVPVFGNATYYVKTSNPLLLFFYDSNKSFISPYISVPNTGGTVTTPSNAKYLRFSTSGNPSITTYNNNICISLSDPSRNGTYEPHWRSELELGLGDIKVKSHNIWDEVWEQGNIANLTGQNDTTGTNRIRSKNYISVTPGGSYNVTNKSSVNVYIYYYASDQSFISAETNDYVSGNSNKIYTIPSNCYFIRFRTYDGYGTTYANDICINLSDPAFNGRYEPYGDGGVISITGGLKSAGTAYDEISGGKFVKRIESVDLGSLTWDDSVAEYYQTGSITDMAQPANNNTVFNNMVTPKGYTPVSAITMTSNDKCMAIWSTSKRFGIRDTSYATLAAFQAAIAGVSFYYQLAQPIEYELAEAIPTAMRNDPYGTERRLPEDTAAIVTAPFRADITYSTNIKEAVQSMHQNFINVNSMQDFLAELGTLMGGTWTMRPADGKFDFTFTPNPSNE